MNQNPHSSPNLNGKSIIVQVELKKKKLEAEIMQLQRELRKQEKSDKHQHHNKIARQSIIQGGNMSSHKKNLSPRGDVHLHQKSHHNESVFSQHKKQNLNKPVISQSWKNMFNRLQPQIYDPFQRKQGLSIDDYRPKIEHTNVGRSNSHDNPYDQDLMF